MRPYVCGFPSFVSEWNIYYDGCRYMCLYFKVINMHTEIDIILSIKHLEVCVWSLDCLIGNIVFVFFSFSLFVVNMYYILNMILLKAYKGIGIYLSPRYISADFTSFTPRYWNWYLHSFISLGRIQLINWSWRQSHCTNFISTWCPITAGWTEAVWN